MGEDDWGRWPPGGRACRVGNAALDRSPIARVGCDEYVRHLLAAVQVNLAVAAERLSVLQVALPEESPDAWTVIVLAPLDPRGRDARGRANATRGATADITAVADIVQCEYR